MISKLTCISLAVVVLAFASVAVGQNLVLNGNFATGDFTDWTLTGNQQDVGVCNASTCPGGFAPLSTYAAYFGPVGSYATLSQMIPTTPGDQYTLTFYLADPVAGTPNYFSSSFGNATLTLNNWGTAFGWQEFNLITTVTGSSTELSFTFRNDPAYWFLDNVTILQGSSGTVPEPSSVLLFGSGLLGVFGLARRKFRL